MMMPTIIERPRHFSADDALGQHRHQAGLRRRKLTVTETDTAAVDVGLIQQQQHGKQREAGHGDAEEVASLHLGGSAAENVSDLEVLQHLAGHGRGDADDSGHAEHGGHAVNSRDTYQHHQ